MKVLVYMEAQMSNGKTQEYSLFEGELKDASLSDFRLALRKEIVKTHAKVKLQ